MSFACLPMKTLPLYPWLRLLTLPYPLFVHASVGTQMMLFPLDNGFIFNPYNHDSIHQALDFILSHKLRLHDLGTKSYQYVDKIYNPDKL